MWLIVCLFFSFHRIVVENQNGDENDPVCADTENDNLSLDLCGILCRAPLIIPCDFSYNDSFAHSISSIAI